LDFYVFIYSSLGTALLDVCWNIGSNKLFSQDDFFDDDDFSIKIVSREPINCSLREHEFMFSNILVHEFGGTKAEFGKV
jgi:hypothetical protein